jgi:hypothetical protein
VAAVLHLEEDMHVRAVLASGRYVVLAHGVSEAQPEYAGIEVDRLAGVTATEGGVMQFLAEHEGLLWAENR